MFDAEPKQEQTPVAAPPQPAENPEPAPSAEPVAPSRFTPEDLEARIADMSPEELAQIDDPVQYIQDNVVEEGQAPTPQPAGPLTPAPAEPQAPKPPDGKNVQFSPDNAEEINKMESVKDFMKLTEETLGEKYDTPYQLLKSTKNKLTGLQSYREDAMKNKSLAEQRAKELADAQKVATELQERVKALETQSQQAPSSIPQQPAVPAFTEQAPELPPEDALPEEWKKYNADITAYFGRKSEYDKKVLTHELEQKIASVSKDVAGRFKTIEQMQAEAKAKAQAEAKAEMEKKEAERAFNDTCAAANAFLEKHAELKFADGKTVAEKNTEYQQFVDQLSYLSQTEAGYQGRNLADEFVQGVPGVVDLVNRRAINVPQDLGKFLHVVELEGICRQHNFMSDGKPDFEGALAYKKHLTGVSIDEKNEAYQRGVNQTLDVVSSHNEPSPAISPAEGVKESAAHVQVGEEQLLTQVTAIQSDLQNGRINEQQYEEQMKNLEVELQKINLFPA